MPTKPIERLLFTQGGACFFCQGQLSPAEASVEHLVATANGGGNADDNCVACCKALNTLLGRMSLKEKLRVVLNQKGAFKCPNGPSKLKASATLPDDAVDRVIVNLRKQGDARPGTLKTLTSTINNLFQKQLSQSQLTALVNQLKMSGVIAVSGTKVSYAIPSASV